MELIGLADSRCTQTKRFKTKLIRIRDNRVGFFVDYSPLSLSGGDDLPVRPQKVNQITRFLISTGAFPVIARAG